MGTRRTLDSGGERLSEKVGELLRCSVTGWSEVFVCAGVARNYNPRVWNVNQKQENAITRLRNRKRYKIRVVW